ncbi:MAG TPA: hypothetical protein EYQ00_15440 [Dehalococcoidia bacterium]|nr:hypothetical protein [Dehalococcoidia bacterium]
MVHVITNTDYWNPDFAHDTEWEIKQLESAIDYYSSFINSTTSREEKYELESLLNRQQRELDDLKDEYDV